MHPAASVIFFTTASGAGYGLLALLGVVAALGQVAPTPWFGLVAFALALGLITFGLLSSMFHLGHPERAWRALTQWRSSWLSREGVVALVTYAPAGLFAIGWIFLGRNGGVWAALGIAAAVLAVITVACTGMIYASLTTIPRWSNGWVVPVYLAFALATGALWLNALLVLFGREAAWIGWLGAAATALAWLVKLGYWRHIDGAPARSTAESATGLGGLGTVRLFEAPHTEQNYVMREMGYTIARKHARRLRRLAWGTGGIVPLLLAIGAAVLPAGAAAIAAALLAALLVSVGALIERWLFFAEAQHVVTLYYGTAAV